jgi:hypothetical protein
MHGPILGGEGRVTLGFELRALHLQSRHSDLSHTSSLFCSGRFGDGDLMNYLSGLALNLYPSNVSYSPK